MGVKATTTISAYVDDERWFDYIDCDLLKICEIALDAVLQVIDVSNVIASTVYAEIDVAFTHNKKIQELNARYRNKNKPTNILSFSYIEDLQSEIYIIDPSLHSQSHPMCIGDVFVSYDVVVMEMLKENISKKKYLIYLLIHGILHVFGYDHVLDEDWKKMCKYEEIAMSIVDVGLDENYKNL